MEQQHFCFILYICTVTVLFYLLFFFFKQVSFSQQEKAQGQTAWYNDMLCVFCAEIREAFRVLDRDGNGFISKQELGMAMRSLGYMPSEVELAIIMQRLDMDGETLHKDTHLGACTERTNHTEPPKMCGCLT